MIIDAHTHIFGKEIIQKRDWYCSVDSCFKVLYSQEKAKLCSANELIDIMDACGISMSVVLNIGWESHEMCVQTNDYILESISKYPKRLIGFCAIQPLAHEKALKELERCHLSGAKGLGELRPDVQGFDLCNTELMMPLIEMAAEKEMLITLHASEPVGHEYSGKGRLTPEILYRFISKFPKFRGILAHFGGGLPFYELMPEVSEALKNTFYDTAAAPFLYSSDIYDMLKNLAESKKLLFGSDFPLLNPMRVIKHIKSSNLNKNEIDNILGNSAINLLSLEQKGF